MLRRMIFFILYGISCDVFCESISAKFEVIEKGWSHGADIKRVYGVNEIRTKEAWETFWRELKSNYSPEPQLPVVDFSKWFVVAVIDRSHPNLCYHFETTNVYVNEEYSDSVVNVSINYVIPGSGAGCLAAQAKNYEIIKVKRSK